VIPVRVLPQAEAELLHEVEYYSNARTGTGIRFQAAVDASIDNALRVTPWEERLRHEGHEASWSRAFHSASCIALTKENCWSWLSHRIVGDRATGCPASGDG
jgi:hypothetical protein